MALTGYYKTLMRPRTHRPLSMLKYDPVGMCVFYTWTLAEEARIENGKGGEGCSNENQRYGVKRML